MLLQQLVPVLFLGLVSSGSPCALPLYPGFLAYLSRSESFWVGRRGSFFLGLLVLLGVLTMMLAMGFILASLSIAVGRALSVAVPLADALIIGLGALLLANRNPFARLPQPTAPLFQHPYASAYVYGLIYGPLTLPCSGALMVSLFALSISVGDFLNKLLFFSVYGLGFGIPLLVLSLLARVRQEWLVRAVAERSALFNRVAGTVLIGVAVYDLTINFEFLRLYLS
ncbi:MAG: hypothetical protein HYZ68_06160 [Chloroflexi bacterium]|nr:hypothetical protein [Chloroflexota bacterium]